MHTRNVIHISVAVLAIVALTLFGALGQLQYADAFLPGGGFHASIVMWCTCGPGYLSLVVGTGATLSGLYYFAPYTIPLNATSMMPGSFWLGYYTPFAGVCMIYVGLACSAVLGNLMTAYGAAF